MVVVAQGTETPDYNELIIPTMNGLADRDNVVVVAILCCKGASLTGQVESDAAAPIKLPSNARVVDYFPYDALLEYADIFVSASGYGGLTHAVGNSVPLVQTGRLLDKADIGRRVEYSGMGVYLEGKIDPEDVSGAVDKILQDYQGFKDRATKLKEESRNYQPLEILEREILGLAKPTH